MLFLTLFERQDLPAIDAATAELDELLNGIEALFTGFLDAFQKTDINDPAILGVRDALMNDITIGKWDVQFVIYSANPDKNGGKVLADVTGNRIRIYYVPRIKAMLRLLERYRMSINRLQRCLSGEQAYYTEQAQAKVDAQRKEAATIVRGVIKKLRSPEMRFILQHEIHHNHDSERVWFNKSVFDMKSRQMDAYDQAEKEVQDVLARAGDRDATIALSTGKTLNVTKNPGDRARYTNMRADQLRYTLYHASSHEYNANTRAAISIALARKRSWPDTVDTFKKAYLTWNSVPENLRRNALQRLYLAYVGK